MVEGISKQHKKTSALYYHLFKRNFHKLFLISKLRYLTI